MHSLRTAGPVLIAIALLVRPVRADFLDGRCVNSQNQGVAAVNIDARDAGGNDVGLSNDGTDANGFFHVTIPNGTYQVIFKPPQPPASTDLVTEIGPVIVNGTANVGTIQLLPGVALTGRVTDPGSQGVQGVDIDVVDLTTGAMVDLIHDTTDATGDFNFASPSGSIELQFDPAPSGQTLAPVAMELNLSGNTNLGTIQLAQGFVVGAIVRDPGNNPVPGVDVDVEVSSTGADLYTPGDNSNSSGFVDVVVPAGTYDFEFCPPPSLGLASKRISGVTVASNTSLGIVSLQNGFVLSGQVRSYQNVPIQGVSVVLRNPVTGADIPVCHNITDSNGNYSTIAPPGTYNVCAIPPASQTFGAGCAGNVAINGPTTVNLTLPAAFTLFCFGDGSLPTLCPCGNFGAAGRGCDNSPAGVGGASLSASGTTHPDTAVLTASGTLPTALCIFLQGNSEIVNGVVFGDGVRCTGGSLKRIGVKNAVGGVASYPGSGDTPIRQRSAQLGDTIPLGATRLYQTYYRDANAGFCPNPPGNTFNISSGVRAVW